MKTALVLGLATLALAGCASSGRNDSEREWQRAECNRIIDSEGRQRCLKRIDEDYGTRRNEVNEGPRKP